MKKRTYCNVSTLLFHYTLHTIFIYFILDILDNRLFMSSIMYIYIFICSHKQSNLIEFLEHCISKECKLLNVLLKIGYRKDFIYLHVVISSLVNYHNLV